MKRRPRRQAPARPAAGQSWVAGAGPRGAAAARRGERCVLAGSGAAGISPARQPGLPCRLLAGDWSFRYRARKRSDIVRNVRQVLGDELSPEEAEGLAREFFRMRSCEVIDVMLLRGQARSLRKLVEIRGREHLDAALAGGKGAILCSAHFGSCTSGFSLLHVSGFPITSIGRRWPGNDANVMSSAERWFLELAYTRRVRPYHQRPTDRAPAGPGSGRGAGRTRASRQ